MISEEENRIYLLSSIVDGDKLMTYIVVSNTSGTNSDLQSSVLQHGRHSLHLETFRALIHTNICGETLGGLIPCCNDLSAATMSTSRINSACKSQILHVGDSRCRLLVMFARFSHATTLVLVVLLCVVTPLDFFS